MSAGTNVSSLRSRPVGIETLNEPTGRSGTSSDGIRQVGERGAKGQRDMAVNQLQRKGGGQGIMRLLMGGIKDVAVDH